MHNTTQNAFSLAARLLLALLFLPAGISKITGFDGTVGYIASVGLPTPEIAAAVALVVEIAGGAALILGFGTRIAAFALAIFTLTASFYFHNFWALTGEQQFMQQLLFFKNIAVTGGLLSLVAFGAGGWSIDARRIA